MIDRNKSIGVTHPELLKEFSDKNEKTAFEYTQGSGKKVLWKCSVCGNEWSTRISHRTASKSGCPECSKLKISKARKAVVGDNSLLVQFPEIAKEWDYEKNETSPENITPKTNDLFYWICSVNPEHKWKASVNNRTSGTGCPFCKGARISKSRKKPKKGESLGDIYPEIIAEWSNKNYKTPFEFRPFSTQKAWFTCVNGHEDYIKAIAKYTQSNQRCPVCALKQRANNCATSNLEDSLGHNYPDLLKEWSSKNKKSPFEVYPHGGKKAWWLCENGHDYHMSITKKTSRDYGCPICSNKQVVPGFNDLKTVYPEIVEGWDYEKNTIAPTNITPYSGKYVWWKCENGHSCCQQVVKRTRRHYGCPQCSKTGISTPETEVLDFIKEHYDGNIIKNNRSILSGKELDIVLPDKNIAFEFNGIYWHSEQFKDQYYHYNKVKECNDLGIDLFSIWEDDWLYRNEQVKRMILHKIGASNELRVFARKCQIDLHVDTTEAKDFADKNHIQGYGNSTFKIGLRHDDKLVALMLFTETQDSMILNRYCTSCNVIGGFTKLLHHFDNKDKKIITFADLSVSNGSLYYKTGFILDKVLKPDYKYVIGDKRVHKFNYRKKRFKEDESLLFDENMTERELADLNGISRIWDCGKLRFCLT